MYTNKEVVVYYIKSIYLDKSQCNDDFVKGIEFLEQCSVEDSVTCFKNACNSNVASDQLLPKYKSYYALSCLLNGDDEAISICRSLVNICPHDADVCLNLARAEAFINNRKEALQAIDRGLVFSVHHDGLNALKSKLGVRGRRFVPFLSRNNLLNIALGRFIRGKK